MPLTASANLRMIFALTLVHFTGDVYSAFISPLFPAFVDRLGLTLTQVGIVAGTARFLAFIVQPTVGYFADRFQTRIFSLGGLALAVVFIPLAGLAPAFWFLLLMVAVGSVGSSMFHPSVTGMIPLYAGRQAGLCMSIFNTGGTFAFAVGPVFVTAYVARFGLTALPWTMAFGLFVLAYLYRVLPPPQSEGLAALGFRRALKDSLGHVWRILVMIWLVMVMRALVGQSFLTFMPVLMVREGHTLTGAGGWFALFTVAGTLSGLTAGHLADRIGFKPVFLASHLMMTPALFMLLACRGTWVYLGAFVAGFMVLASLPLGVAMAQQLAPRGRAMVASLMMGLAYGLGGLFTPVVGWLADHYGVRSVLYGVAWIPLLTVILVMMFPKVRSGQVG
jgi:FSR family fosmidomycin resistance protein-like MFS transporter